MFSRYGNTPYLGYSDRQPYAGNYNISSYRRGDASVRTSYYGPSRRTRYSWERDSLINRNRGSNTSRRPVANREAAPSIELRKALNVIGVDLHIPDNTRQHRTSEYDRTSSRSVGDQQLPAELVIRRGDSFRITLTFDRPYDVEMHDIRLNFSLGEVKSSEQGTEVEFYVYEKGRVAFKPFQWDGCIVQLRSNSVTVEVNVSAYCIVGEWTMQVKTYVAEKDHAGREAVKEFAYEHDTDITILFNPWCKEDGTFMPKMRGPDHPNETYDLNEYVLNPAGCVYRGNAWTRGAKPWNFGQFDEGILDVALFLMRRGFKEVNLRGMSDPATVARMIAQWVNSRDDEGILVGNWTGKYFGGTKPTAWAGSVKILQQYKQTGRPVKYAQCWVFSCVTTTVCRALGIPCRTVTNFASAHDTEDSLCIEKYFQKRGGTLEKVDVSFSHDSIWNFHVWNEVWMSRPDLDTHGRFDGWQVIDSTPQEKSNGVFTCGPAPLAAIKEGMCNIKYDTGFVFAEVNADEVHWEQLPKFGTLRRLKLNTADVGKNISTKYPDGHPYEIPITSRSHNVPFSEMRRFDITQLYKYREGSEAERRAVMMAHQTAKAPIPDTYAVEKEQEFLKFKLLHSNEVMIGSDLDVDLVAFNHTGTEQTVTAAFIKVYPKTYDGKTGPMFFKRDFDWVKVRPGGNVPMRATITVRDYLPHIFELANLFIEASASVQSTGSQPPQSVYKSHDFRFRRPDMYVKAPERCYIGRLSQFEVTFRNPLPVRLVNCDISMESDAFEDIRDERVPDVPEWGVFSKTFRLVPRRLRGHHVVFSFDCSTLEDISGSASVYIER